MSAPKIEFRWRKEWSASENALKQEEWGMACYWTLEYRTHASTNGYDIALADPWGPWQEVPADWGAA